MRRAGVLMPVTSLPSPWGVGTMGAAAREFVDFLVESGQTVWQILPIGPTGFGDSPYQVFSTYAGNPYLIDLDELAAEGLLERSEYEGVSWGDDPLSVDYGELFLGRLPVLERACARLRESRAAELASFCARESAWLEDYALFMAIKDSRDGAPWTSWDDGLLRREPAALDEARRRLSERVDFWKAVQCLFFRQWDRLREYAAGAGILLMGDIPIYVAPDSADVWASPEQFQLDERLLPTEVAGCPPDGFAAGGQLWGNPLYDWERMAEDGFSWWVERITYQLRLYDILRIDHFRGFDSYYSIPFGAPDAREGRWREGPGTALFERLRETCGTERLVAEDLGYLTDSVARLREETGLPGMRVLEFAFDSVDGSGSVYLPHSYPRDCVAYVGTHDNDTALGWLSAASPDDVARARDYLGLNEREGEGWGMMRGIWSSVADTAIVQMQDVLRLGGEARMNVPSTVGQNWKWRAPAHYATPELAQRLRRQMELCDRAPAAGNR